MATNIIKMYRGDTFKFMVSVDEIAEIIRVPYQFNESDCFYFGIMEPHQRFEDAILRKRITSDSFEVDDGGTVSTEDDLSYFMIELEPQDTIDLEPGTYYYTIKLRQGINTSEETVATIIPKTKLIIMD